jgi:L-amino acid N-acyltransferase YncA
MVENNQITFREANLHELSFVLDLYNYYILNTTAIFDYEKITVEELQTRLSYNKKKYKAFLVCDTTDKNVVGFCFLTQFRKKPAYARTAEIGIYLKPENTGKKFGQLIIRFLEEYAKENQIEVIIATISAENISSIKLFEKMGYEQCAHYKEVAIKFDKNLDLVQYEKIL